MLRSLWNYRYFILSSIKGDLRGRFVRSNLGALWFILHPLAQALIFTIVLAWGLFSEILTRSMNIFIEQSSVMKKIAFPRLCLPIIVWGSALLNHFLLLVAITVIFMFIGHFPNITWLSLPLGMLLISAMAFGIGVFLGVLNVFTRDVAQAMSVVLQLWFWLTPIVYPRSIIPDQFEPLIALNPMTNIVGLYQDALLLYQWPSLAPLLPPAIIASIAVVLAFIVFRRASPELVDAL